MNSHPYLRAYMAGIALPTFDAAVLRATLDFWTVYLRGDHAAVPALEHDAAVADRTTIQADPASPGRSHRFAKSPGGRAA